MPIYNKWNRLMTKWAKQKTHLFITVFLRTTTYETQNAFITHTRTCIYIYIYIYSRLFCTGRPGLGYLRHGSDSMAGMFAAQEGILLANVFSAHIT